MIKLVALITMLIDHIGAVFFYNTGTLQIFMRCVGRFSMPLFAYCIARSFDHYSKNGNIKKYFRNLTIFAVVSQYPFWFFCKCGVDRVTNFHFFDFFNFFDIFNYLNIGFTWIFSLLFLWAFNKITFEFNKKNLLLFVCSVVVILFSIFLKMDYGLYGVLFTVGFYFFCFKYNSPLLLLLFSLFNYVVQCLEFENRFLCCNHQAILGFFAVFFAVYLQKSKFNFRLPKGIFYIFYPLHLLVIACLQYGFLQKLF